MRHSILALFLLLFSLPSLSSLFGKSDNELGVIAVGEAEVVRERIFIVPTATQGKGGEMEASAKKYDDQLVNNFAFYRRFFEVIKAKPSFSKTFQNLGSFDYSPWVRKSARYLMGSRLVQKSGKGGKRPPFELQVKVFDITQKKEIHSETLPFPRDEKNRRGITHALSDRIYRSMVKRPSIFGSKIVFVSDVQSTKKRMIKELYIMDFDGGRKERLTWHKGIVISPAIDLKRKRVLYSLIRYTRGKRNVNLRLLNLETKKSRLISARAGINSGAVFSPNGKSIFLTMGRRGNAEIYEMNLATLKTRRVTSHGALDVDPSLNEDGSRMAFLSGRPGKAMIYIADTDGMEKNVKRVSYTGQFNATPRFAPSGRELVFSSWQDNRFDLYRIDENGKALARLTRNFGSNESPSYSLDGEFIVFSSLRPRGRKKADQNLYIMDRNGDILGAVTKNYGKCLSPRWSK
ncbi:MAG: hypothetical protein OXB88_01590 [Bacteriovoracales bacterium]|nr:hypothetical protein [Bacteriovoracales bacterium]